MIFVDTNVVMYAVGRSHPLRDEARAFFAQHVEAPWGLVTSAEVQQELLHAYLPVGRMTTLDSALTLIDNCVGQVWSVEPDDARLARLLVDRFAGLGARDLLHLACCRRRKVVEIKTYDRALAAAASSRS